MAQGNDIQAGNGPLFDFSIVFTGQYTVAAPGDVQFNFYSDDGFIFGVGGGATRVSGAQRNPPPGLVTPFERLPWMGDFNGPTAPVANSIVVHFPAAGSYPYELDYSECCAGQLAITMTTSTATGNHGVPPTGSLTPEPGDAVRPTATPRSTCWPSTPRAWCSNLPVTLTVTGPNAQEVKGTTDPTGHVLLTYTGTNTGTDTVQAVSYISNLPIVSGQLGVIWTSSTVGPPPAGQGGPLAVPGLLGAPAAGSRVLGQVPITVGAGHSVSNATIDFWSANDPAAATVLASGVSGGSGATLATLDTTTLANGSYVVRMVGRDGSGTTVASGTLIDRDRREQARPRHVQHHRRDRAHLGAADHRRTHL